MPRRTVSLIVLALLAVPAARADDRRFVWLDEARVTRPGAFEFEQWLTWEHQTKQANNFNVYTLKEEGEIGINDHMQLGFELPSWHFQTGPSDEKQGPRFDAVAADIRYLFTDPLKDPLGVGAKAEVGIGEDRFDIEGRLILQKTFDKLEIAYNLILEAGWNSDDLGRYRERDGELSQVLGVNYEVANKLFIGGEAVHEIPLPEWKTGHQETVWLGPNASFHQTNWAITVAPLFRATRSDEEPLLRFRMVFEIDF